MTDSELAAIEARAAAASPGPWSRIKSLGSRFWTLGTIRSHTAHPLPERNEDADWSFVEHARSDIPSLCQALREATQRERGLRLAAEEMLRVSRDVWGEILNHQGDPVLGGRPSLAREWISAANGLSNVLEGK